MLRVDTSDPNKSRKIGKASLAIGCLLFVWIVIFVFWLLVPEAEVSLGSSLHLRSSLSSRGRDTLGPLHHDKMQLQDDDQVGGRGQDRNNDFGRIQRIVGEGGAGAGGALASGVYADYDHAVIVAGHAVVKFDQIDRASTSPDAWYLLPYQKEQGFPDIIASHIQRGAETVKADPAALLLFSGGETRRDVGPMSEAASYYFVAKHMRWLPEDNVEEQEGKETETDRQTGDSSTASLTRAHPRTFLEEYARDSFENLLFSLCRFREVTGRYPAKVTVVGFDFKERRFSDLHRAALNFPASHFHYIGVKPNSSMFDHKRADDGERDVRRQFAADPYSCSGALEEKRHLRNPFKRTVPYDAACPEIEPLLHWCGPDPFEKSGEKVPWALGSTMH